MRKSTLFFILMLSFISVPSCSDDDDDDNNNTKENEVVADSTKRTLVVYFSKTLPDGVDATSGATNIVKENNTSYGANQYLALMIAKKTNADTLRLTVANGYYPNEYSELATFARSERDNGTHPALTSRTVDMDNYDNVFISTPVWWYTIPMPVYTFLDTYNLSGKKIFVATTHAGSGLANVIDVIEEEEPQATVSDNGLAVSASQVSSASSDVENWVSSIDF